MIGKWALAGQGESTPLQPTKYIGDGLYGAFIAELSNKNVFATNTNWRAVDLDVLGVQSDIYDDTLYFNTNGNWAFGEDEDSKKCLQMNTNSAKYVSLRTSVGYTELKQSELGDSFTFQFSLTYTRRVNYAGMIGIHNARPGLCIGQYEDGVIKFQIFNQGGAVEMPAEELPSGKFNVAFVVEGGQILRVYINGSVWASSRFTSFSSLGSSGIFIGLSYYAGNRYMSGNWYDLLVYKRPLADEEVLENYLHSKSKYLLL